MTCSRNISGWKHSEVLDVFREIIRTGSVPTGVRLALLIEGGALRGVVSCGYAAALSRIVSDRHFEFIYGASSGGLNGVYLAAHSLDNALKVYSENATDPKCVNLWRFPNVLDVDWLVDNWMFGPRTFDVDILHSSPSQVMIVLARMEDGKPFYFDAKNAPLPDLRKAMKATSYTPLLTEKCQIINGVPYGDGAIANTFPYEVVVGAGATHIVCLTTRTETYRKRITNIERLLHRARLVTHTREYIKAYFERPERYNASLELIYNGGNLAVPTLVLGPSNESEIPRSVESDFKVIAQLGDHVINTAASQLRTALGLG